LESIEKNNNDNPFNVSAISLSADKAIKIKTQKNSSNASLIPVSEKNSNRPSYIPILLKRSITLVWMRIAKDKLKKLIEKSGK
jgi:hypothetical protein